MVVIGYLVKIGCIVCVLLNKCLVCLQTAERNVIEEVKRGSDGAGGGNDLVNNVGGDDEASLL